MNGFLVWLLTVAVLAVVVVVEAAAEVVIVLVAGILKIIIRLDTVFY